MANDAHTLGLPLALGNGTGSIQPFIERGNGSPSGLLNRPQGSIFLRTDVSQLWQNTDGAATWTLLATLDTPLGGDLSGTAANAEVVGLEGYPIENPPPTNGDALLFNGLLNRWEHAPIVFGGGPPTGPAGGDLGGIYPNPQVTGLQNDALPATVANGFLKRNPADNGWQQVIYGSAANTVCEGSDARLSNPRAPTGSAGGDLAGTYPNPTVDGLQTRPVASTAPASGEVLAWNGAAWAPAASALPAAVYGSFSDSTSQPLAAGVPKHVQYNTVEAASGVAVQNDGFGKPTKIVVARAGVYAFSISPQVLKGGSGGTVVDFWLEVNGTPVPRSTSRFAVPNNTEVLPFLETILPLNAGDAVEWVFYTPGNNVSLYATAASPPIPAAPSVISGVKLIGA